MHLPKPICEFDIDSYLNRFIPPSPLRHFPRPISHFLGYRTPGTTHHVCAPEQWFMSFAGAFIGVALIEAVFMSEAFKSHNSPLIIGSFGAAAILEYNAISSPLSQPRNFFMSHVFSAAIGISITKLFMLLPPDRFSQLQWLAGALSVGVSSALMSITKTVHPPAGATALLAATSPDIVRDGWWLMVLVVTACGLMGGSALIVNNLGRRWPVYWWTEGEVGQIWRRSVAPSDGDLEKGSEAAREETSDVLSVSADGLQGPYSVMLDDQERAVLEGIAARMKDEKMGGRRSGSDLADGTSSEKSGKDENDSLSSGD